MNNHENKPCHTFFKQIQLEDILWQQRLFVKKMAKNPPNNNDIYNDTCRKYKVKLR